MKGNPFWYLPSQIFDIVIAAFGSPTKRNPETGAYLVDCKYRDPANAEGNVTVRFGAAGEIKVPVHTLVTDHGNGLCETSIGNGTMEDNNLGDEFLRSAYLIYDQEALTITMAQVRYTAQRDIVPYGDGTFVVSGTD
jgi:candidapepsin